MKSEDKPEAARRWRCVDCGFTSNQRWHYHDRIEGRDLSERNSPEPRTIRCHGKMDPVVEDSGSEEGEKK